MKKTFKNVHIDENGNVYLRNGLQMKAVSGIYNILGINYTIDQLKDIWLNNSLMITKKEPSVQHANETRNTQKEQIETRKPVNKDVQHANETRKELLIDQIKHANKQRTGKQNGKHNGTYIIDGKEYQSAHDAAKELNLAPSTIIRRCRSGKNSYSFLSAEVIKS